MELKNKNILEITRKLRDSCDEFKDKIIELNDNVKFVYNPLDYAWEPHKKYLVDYSLQGAKTIIMGMNPGHGMGNTGIPFGCPKKVKKYLNITSLEVKEPAKVHPKRRISGLECEKTEISGKRIWGLIEDLYGSPDNAFKHIFILNHFPLWMFNSEGQNITPDKLSKSANEEIFKICNKYLCDVVNTMEAEIIIGVGKYASKMAKIATEDNKLKGIVIKEIPHPSPANPLANKNKGSVWREISKRVILGNML